MIILRLRSKLKWLLCVKVWRMSIHPSARIASTALLDRTFPGGIKIEEDVVIGEHAAILTHDITRKLTRETRVGARTVIDARAIVLPGVSIGEDCFVVAGAVVSADVPDQMIVSGNPARFSVRTTEVES